MTYLLFSSCDPGSLNISHWCCLKGNLKVHLDRTSRCLPEEEGTPSLDTPFCLGPLIDSLCHAEPVSLDWVEKGRLRSRGGGSPAGLGNLCVWVLPATSDRHFVVPSVSEHSELPKVHLYQEILFQDPFPADDMESVSETSEVW